MGFNEKRYLLIEKLSFDKHYLCTTGCREGESMMYHYELIGKVLDDLDLTLNFLTELENTNGDIS